MKEEIIAIARALASPNEEEESLLQLLCAAAEQELTAALGEELQPADCREAFLCAAGCLAAAGLLSGRDGGESFRVGEVSVTGGSARGALLRQQAKRLMAPYTGGSFAFREVRG